MEEKRSISFELRTLSNLVKREIIHVAGFCGDDGLSPMHGFAIGYFYLHRGEDVFQRDFEKEFTIRRSTATRILQLMEKNGYIIREPMALDARLKKIYLTDKAVRLHEEVLSEIERLNARLEGGLTPEERAQFFVIADKIKANLALAPDTLNEEHQVKECKKENQIQ